MYNFLRAFRVHELVIQQAPCFATSLIIAEFFYKFHSFTLETLAFLGTWFVLDALATMIRKLYENSRQKADVRAL